MDMTKKEMQNAVHAAYDIEHLPYRSDAIRHPQERIGFRVKTQKRVNKRNGEQVIENDTAYFETNGVKLSDWKGWKKNQTVTENITLEDFTLVLIREKGDRYEENCSCNGEWMKNTLVEKAGFAIREYYYWVKPDVEIVLQLDGAGGHGGIEMKKEYTDLMKSEWNVKIVVQPSGCPHLNYLDLGVWHTMDAIVDMMGRFKRTTIRALDHNVFEAWKEVDSQKLINCCDRIITTCAEIIKGQGTVEFLESIRGKDSKAEIAKYKHPTAVANTPAPGAPPTVKKIDFDAFERGSHTRTVNNLKSGDRVEWLNRRAREWESGVLDEEVLRGRQNDRNRPETREGRTWKIKGESNKEVVIVLRHANEGTQWRKA